MKRSELQKLTFLGDIMCEKPLLKAYQRYGNRIFDQVFSKTKALFSDSDYVIGNLETVFGGNEKGYTRELYRFNTPDTFAEALSRGGIHMVTMATNHCLDSGIDGLTRTMDVLDRVGVEHTGAFRSESDARILIKELGNIKVAFLNYTYGTNVLENNVVLSKDQLFHVNLLKPQTTNRQTYVLKKEISPFRLAVSKLLGRFFSSEVRMRLKKLLHLEYNAVRVDHLDPKELDERYLKRLQNDLRQAEEAADFVIACIHSGGQFNLEPGDFTKYIVKFLIDNGADAIIGNHPHVVQRLEQRGPVPVAYCLGNYSISPSSIYLRHELKPSYSVALHLYFSQQGIQQKAFSILKIAEGRRHGLEVVPADVLWEESSPREKERLLEDVREIYHRFTGIQGNGVCVQREYTIS